MKKYKLFWILFAITLLISLGAEQFVQHKIPTEGEIGIENRPYFYAWFGFASCVIIIVVSKILGLFLKRKDDYYKEDKK